MDVYSKWQEQKVEQQKVGKEGTDGTMKQLNIYISHVQPCPICLCSCL